MSEILRVPLTDRQLDAVRDLADEQEIVDWDHPVFGPTNAPMFSEVFIDSSADGWQVAVSPWSGLYGTADDLMAVARSLAATGREGCRAAALIIVNVAQEKERI